MPDRPLDADEIRVLLTEVADELPEGERPTIVVAGGALLAFHALRATTADVDAVRRLPDAVRNAARVVAGRHDLSPNWLNDSATAFRPDTLTDADCEVLLDHPRLRILGVPLRDVFLMKVDAARTRDYDDLVALWPLAGFDSARQAEEEYRRAFPGAADDPYLVDWIEGIARRATDR